MSDSAVPPRANESFGDRTLSRWLAAGIVVSLALVAGAYDLFDYDLGLSRATGKYILEHGVPRTNVFSAIHEAFPFVDDKWLFHVFSYLVVDGASPMVAVLVRMGFLALAFVWLLPRRGASSLEQFCGAMLAVVAIATSYERFAFRPELFTFCFLVLLWRRLRDPYPLTVKDFCGLLAMQWVWTNSHGYFVLGPILAGSFAAGAFLDARWRRDTFAPGTFVRLLLLPFALLVVGIANPYGVDLLLSPVRILIDLRGYESTFKAAIVEFVAPFSYHPRLSFDLVAYRVLLATTALGLLLRCRHLRGRELLPLLVFFAMSLDLRRNIAPFALVAAPLVAGWLAAAVPSRFERAFAGLAAWTSALAALGLAFGFATDKIAVHDRLDRAAGFGESAIAHPDLEIEFVKEHLPEDGMFNSFTFGSTFVGRAYPPRRPFIDGNTAGYPPEFLRKYVSAVKGEIEPAQLVLDHGLRYFLVRPGHALTARLLADDRFVPIFLGRHAVVIVVKDRVDATLIERFDLRPALRSGATSIGVVTPPSEAFPIAELNRARLELASNLPRRAAATIERAFLQHPAMRDDGFELFHALAAARIAEQQWKAALDALDRAQEIVPGSAEIAADRAMVLAALSRHEEADRSLAHAVDLRGEDAELAERAAQLAAARRDLVAVRSALRRAIELADSDAAKARLRARLDSLPE